MLYFNDGSCVHTNGVTAIEIVEGTIALVRWSVKTRRDGLMFIGKDILAGPRMIDGYFEQIKQKR